MCRRVCFFFFNDPATTEIYTLSLHDALPSSTRVTSCCSPMAARGLPTPTPSPARRDRKSTRLNSRHMSISYAVFCFKKKNNNEDFISLKVVCQDCRLGQSTVEHV